MRKTSHKNSTPLFAGINKPFWFLYKRNIINNYKISTKSICSIDKELIDKNALVYFMQKETYNLSSKWKF